MYFWGVPVLGVNVGRVRKNDERKETGMWANFARIDKLSSLLSFILINTLSLSFPSKWRASSHLWRPAVGRSVLRSDGANSPVLFSPLEVSSIYFPERDF